MNTRHTPAAALEQRAATTHADIEAVVLAEPKRIWRGTDIADRTDHRLVDVMVALAVLTGEGRIERVAAGCYRSPTATPAELIAQLDDDLFGDDLNP